jgi:hypothetical protein
VVAAKGKVVARTPENVNMNIPTGNIEIKAEEIYLLNDCEPLPIQLNEAALAEEDLRKISLSGFTQTLSTKKYPDATPDYADYAKLSFSRRFL